MKFIGLFLLLAGLVSLIIGSTGANLLVLNWVNQWGEGIGWAIRAGVAALGGVLYYIYRHED
ncbi:hypothetical protein [Pontibacter ramchanderi]|uniref:DUF378 domain-containing protein n=1 Tax=Pontibacter ramchanderi TaxID=1179743 RepID=A0A2N3UBZ9_9BACT|nr:hypothetical protein [Pontibacter ramchanderi]PKV66892.1 hypothetical protein BD749_2029 [Pontibacter ramchanderi]